MTMKKKPPSTRALQTQLPAVTLQPAILAMTEQNPKQTSTGREPEVLQHTRPPPVIPPAVAHPVSAGHGRMALQAPPAVAHSVGAGHGTGLMQKPTMWEKICNTQRQQSKKQPQPPATTQLTGSSKHTTPIQTHPGNDGNGTELLHSELNPELQQRLKDLEQQWEVRSSAWKSATSDAWQRTQARFLWVLLLPDEQKIEEFAEMRDANDWSYGSMQQYWSAMTKAAQVLGIPITAEMRIHGKVLGHLKDQEDSRRPTKPATEEQIAAATKKLQKYPRLALALWIAFLLGQRVGDTLQVETSQLTLIDDRASGNHFLGITYRRGKTIKRRQPFTLHLKANHPIAKQLWETRPDETRLFCKDSFRLEALEILRDALKSVDDELGVLSVRRGGLQKMALDGASLETLMHHGRHSSVELLNRYLGWGRLNLIAARELAATSTNMQTHTREDSITTN